MRPQPPSDPHLELVRDLATRTAEVEAANAQQEALRTALDDTQRKLDAAIAQLTEQAAQLGRLEEVTTQRDAIQQQFTALTASVQQLVSDAVRAAVGEATAHQEAAAAQWEGPATRSRSGSVRIRKTYSHSANVTARYGCCHC